MLTPDEARRLHALQKLERALSDEAGTNTVPVPSQNRARAHLELVKLEIALLHKLGAERDEG